jgi:hypothetical protein
VSTHEVSRSHGGHVIEHLGVTGQRIAGSAETLATTEQEGAWLAVRGRREPGSRNPDQPMTQPTSRIAGCVSPGARRRAIARLAAWIVCSALWMGSALLTAACGENPDTFFDTFQEIKAGAVRMGCVAATPPSGDQSFTCSLLLGPCSCRLEVELQASANGAVVDVVMRECPAGPGSAPDRNKLATQVMELLKPMIPSTYSGIDRNTTLASWLFDDAAPGAAYEVDTVRIVSSVHRRFGDLYATVVWAPNYVEESRAKASRAKALWAFPLKTTTTSLRLMRYQDTFVGDSTKAEMGPPVTFSRCLDGTTRSWQQYAFMRETPPNVLPAPKPRVANQQPRSPEVILRTLVEAVEAVEVHCLVTDRGHEQADWNWKAAARIAQLLTEADAELSSLGPIPRDDAGTAAIDRLRNIVDSLFEAGVLDRADLRESHLEAVFALEDHLRRLVGATSLGRARRFYEATQTQLTFFGG